MNHIAAKPAFLLSMLLCLVVGTQVCGAQTFLTEQAQRIATAPEPTELGYVESANGTLHLEVPLGSFPQRNSAATLDYRLIYDNSFWIVGSSGKWTPRVDPFLGAGWRQTPQLIFAPVYVLTTNSCSNTYSDFSWTDPAGVAHSFAVKTIQLINPGSNCAVDTPTGDAFATDASGYHIYVTSYTVGKVYGPDGTLVSTGTNLANGNTVISMDTNGNYFSYTKPQFPVQGPPDTIYDTSGHSFPQTTQSGGVPFFVNPVMPTSQGSSTFPITFATINLKTAFGQSGVGECTTNCTANVIQSIGLPDGTAYSFKYDCDSTSGNAACGSPGGQTSYYGVMTSMTLPTGGTITYGYMLFTDPYGNKNLFLNARSAAGGNWSYTPSVLTTCAPQTTGCQQKVVVTKPNNDRTEYTFVLNNGVWPTQTQHFDGVTGNLLSSEFGSWDFSIACPLTNCIGASFVRKTMEAITLPTGPGGSGPTVTKQTMYFYDSPQSANITTIKEWTYVAGAGGVQSFPLVPDRARYVTYLSTGVNNINRPKSVTVCNNSGSDPDCNGAGSKVSRTVFEYDNYGTSSCRGNQTGLIPVTGTVNHDDANFGVANTARGNITAVKKWVSGTTYLTTTYFYDTTGQVVQETDPAGNVTCYDYTDNFFTDNGANPPAVFTAPQPTNTYTTGITVPLIGTEHRGYYFGSGKQGVSTDQNGASLYLHYADALDRPTSKTFPSGWSLTNYSGATQIDTYTAVGDTLPSTSCTSCRHIQTTFDNMGRRVFQKLMNNPGGAANLATGFDTNGRMQSASHPYINITDPNHVFEQYSYDGLDRSLGLTHPDGQSSSVVYGALVAGAGGLAAQQGDTSTYGIGYPVLTADETGRKIQKWMNGFGQVIEVDEPGGTPGSPASGTLTVSGTLQTIPATNPAPGTGSVTFSGSEQSKQVGATPATPGTGTVSLAGTNQCTPDGLCDNGLISITVNGSTSSVPYPNGDPVGFLAQYLTNAINQSNAYATATWNGNYSFPVITLTARTSGSGTNYSLSTLVYSNDPADFSPPSYTATPSGPTLTGGTNANPGTTVYDHGTCTVTINGTVYSRNFGQGDSTSTIASALATTISGGSLVNASASGATISLTAKATGASTNYSLSSSCSYDSSNFSSPSFTGGASGSSLTGGSNGTPAIVDAGTVQMSVDGYSATANYGSGTGLDGTASAVASDLAAKIQAQLPASNPPFSILASGANVNFTWNSVGTLGNVTVTTIATTTKPGSFSHPSFAGCLPISANPQNCSTNLTGGQDPGSSFATPTVTLYKYDGADRLTTVVQGVQTRTFVYDGLGRMTSQTTPEAGTVLTAYTTASGALCSGDARDLCSVTDARGVVTNFSYDALNRLLAKSYTIPQGSAVSAMPNNICTPTGGQTQANVCFYYDQGGAAAFALGRLTSISDPSGSESHVNDAMGQVTQIVKTIGGTSYTTRYQYDANGDITQITYPSGRVVQQSYNAIGQLCEIAPSTTGCSTAASPYATGYTYDAASQMTGFNYGNGVGATFSYDPNRSQLTALAYKKGTQTLFSLNYFYKADATNCPGGVAGNNGQINCIVDSVQPGRSATYAYDSVGRFTSALTSGSSAYPKWGLTETYDRYGNRSTQSVTAGSGPPFSVVFDQTKNRPNGYTYDLSGNLTIEPLTPPNNYVYDGENRMTSYSGGGGNATYVYDAQGQRVQKGLQGGATTTYVFAFGSVIAEYDNGAAPGSPSREYIYSQLDSSAQLLATLTGPTGATRVFHHQDQLSVRLITDGTPGSPTLGQALGEEGHFPFGEAWYQTGTGTKWFFTSYERDGETGLDYAMARYYNARVAAFCSTDPVQGDIDDPQSWNRYAYVENDPINMVDPNGESFLSVLLNIVTLGLEQFFGGNSFITTTGGSSGDNQDLLILADSAAVGAEFLKGKAKPKAKPKAPPRSRLCVTLPGHEPSREGEDQKTLKNWEKHPDQHGGALSQEVPNSKSVAVNPQQFGMNTKQMQTLRKRNKGITGTLTDDKGNSTDFSVDDVIDSKKYKGNVAKQVAQANKQQRTLLEEEGKDYGGEWQHDKMATYYGWMVHCPPGTREVIITGTFQ